MLAHADKATRPRHRRRGLNARYTTMSSKHLPLWEVFIRSRRGLDHKHIGSLHAADAAQAMQSARDTYTRRQKA
ncbi:MAG: hypothetical protein IPG43_22155 [Proteobacteria bacterium]|nr:hypothetical protein [Pseudomonadota bacterium]